MDIKEAINHCREVAAGKTEQGKCPECAADHRQLADWLEELERYKSIGPVEHFRQLAEGEKSGRLLPLPFVAMVERFLVDGKMSPKREQNHNGIYAVVYFDKKKWKSPLIDICGKKPYDREAAEARMSELLRAEAEAAVERLKGEGAK